MAAIRTARNAIDRKLHRIVMEADRVKFSNFIVLARHIAGNRYEAFSYPTEKGIRYAQPSTIATYVSFAQRLGLLDPDLAPARPKRDVRSRDGFHAWLGAKAMNYLEENNASLDGIYLATLGLFGKTPHELPTIENLRRELGTTIDADDLRKTLKVISLLRPQAFKIKMRQLYIHPSAIKL